MLEGRTIVRNMTDVRGGERVQREGHRNLQQ